MDGRAFSAQSSRVVQMHYTLSTVRSDRPLEMIVRSLGRDSLWWAGEIPGTCSGLMELKGRLWRHLDEERESYRRCHFIREYMAYLPQRRRVPESFTHSQQRPRIHSCRALIARSQPHDTRLLRSYSCLAASIRCWYSHSLIPSTILVASSYSSSFWTESSQQDDLQMSRGEGLTHSSADTTTRSNSCRRMAW